MISRVRRSAVALVAALAVSASLAAPTAYAQPPARPSIAIPIVGTVGDGGTFAGTFTLTRFVEENGDVFAFGTLTGVVTSATGAVTTILSAVALPVNVTQAACDILHLDLGPLSLNLLGLQVDLSRIVLDITAQPGPGNLLGNLLCAVAGLLDNPNGLANLLNRLLGALTGR